MAILVTNANSIFTCTSGGILTPVVVNTKFLIMGMPIKITGTTFVGAGSCATTAGTPCMPALSPWIPPSIKLTQQKIGFVTSMSNSICSRGGTVSPKPIMPPKVMTN